MSNSTNIFLDLPAGTSQKKTSKVSVVPVPFEQTTSYGTGTLYAPQSIIEASAQVELWDEELKREPCEIGIYTEPMIRPADNWTDTAKKISAVAQHLVKSKKFPFFLGGEHSISAPIISGILKEYPDITVLHLDAHADLRNKYQNKSWSHACVMRRIHDMGVPFCSVGVRSLSKEEHLFIERDNLNIVFANEINNSDSWIEKIIDNLGENVYLTFDIDVIDISEIRSTGTPEPGGILWYNILELLKKLSHSDKNFIGADLVEFSPTKHDPTSAFYAAKLIYKIISYLA